MQNWEWCISSNPNITCDIIKDNPLHNWDWQRISSNPNITMDIIRNNPDKPWEWCISLKIPLQKKKKHL